MAESSNAQTILYSFAALACVAVAQRYFAWCLSYPVADGPQFARWSNAWYLRKTWQGMFERWNIDAHASGNKVVRIGPRMYSIDDPAAINDIYGISSPHPKSAWYLGFADPRIPDHNLFSARNRTFHAAMRRKIGNMYSMSAIKSYEPYVDNCVAALLQQLERCIKKNQPVDLQHWMQCYAFDVIGEITFSNRVGFLESGGQDIDGIMKALEDSVAFSTLSGIQPFLAPLLFLLFGHPAKAILSFAKKMNERAASTKGGAERDGGSTFQQKLDAAFERDPEAYKMYHMDVAADGNVAAGSDTTSISLTSALYYMITTPGVLKKLRGEIADVLGPEAAENSVTFEQASGMPYLQNCIKEALRLHPATGLPLWREIVGEGVKIAGTTFPPGAIVGINPWVAHRNTSIYGQDADVFRPERWDPAVTPRDQLEAMEKYYLPFGAGSRSCIGKHISHLEMVKVIPVLVQSYDFEHQDEPLDYSNMWFVKPKQFLCKLKRRDAAKMG